MSVIAEVILHRAVVQGFRHLRKDSRLLDTIFKNLSQVELAAVKQLVLNTPLDFSINYPRTDMKIPAIVLLLKNETEAQTFLGDVMGDSNDPFVPEQELTIDTLGGNAASTSGLSGLPRKFAGPIDVDYQDGTSTIYFQDETELADELTANPVGCLQLYVVAGAGAGHVYNVARIRNDGLDIDTSFVVNLDNTSVIDLRVPNDPELTVGEPSRVYSENASLVRKGANYEVTYYLQILGEQPEHVIYLYAVLKALLLSQRVFLESQGIMAFQISGTDFSHMSEFLPDQVFQRQMTLTFTYPFSFLEEEQTYNQIAIDLLPEPYEDRESAIILGQTIDLSIV